MTQMEQMRLRIEIAIAQPGQLFNAPTVDPLALCMPERLGMSGVDGLLEDLQMRHRLESVTELVVSLPAVASNPALVDQVKAALKAHLSARIQRHLYAIQATARYGWRAFVVALGLLALCLGLSSIFASDGTEAHTQGAASFGRSACDNSGADSVIRQPPRPTRRIRVPTPRRMTSTASSPRNMPGRRRSRVEISPVA